MPGIQPGRNIAIAPHPGGQQIKLAQAGNKIRFPARQGLVEKAAIAGQAVLVKRSGKLQGQPGFIRFQGFWAQRQKQFIAAKIQFQVFDRMAGDFNVRAGHGKIQAGLLRFSRGFNRNIQWRAQHGQQIPGIRGAIGQIKPEIQGQGAVRLSLRKTWAALPAARAFGLDAARIQVGACQGDLQAIRRTVTGARCQGLKAKIQTRFPAQQICGNILDPKCWFVKHGLDGQIGSKAIIPGHGPDVQIQVGSFKGKVRRPDLFAGPVRQARHGIDCGPGLVQRKVDIGISPQHLRRVGNFPCHFLRVAILFGPGFVFGLLTLLVPFNARRPAAKQALRQGGVDQGDIVDFHDRHP